MTKDANDSARPTQNVAELVHNHERFIAFLRSRVGSTQVAEDILQAAYMKGIERSETIRDDEAVIAWFKRLLRNAVIDHYRHRDAERRGLARYGEETLAAGTDSHADFDGTVCACVTELIPTLKPEYGELLRRVELDGQLVRTAAVALGVTPNNAGVRLHRAREALRVALVRTCGACTEHGCVECDCKS